MPTRSTAEIVRRLRDPSDGDGRADELLLGDFVRRRDVEALEVLVRRHGPMVWGVCRRVLACRQDAEDAFQATFVVLVAKAAHIARPATLGNWLYGVAHTTAVRVRATNAKRVRRHCGLAAVAELAEPSESPSDSLARVLDAELARLPGKYRAVIALCDLESRTRAEAARELGVPEGTVASRLVRARALLGKRLLRRGFGTASLPCLLVNAATATTPPALTSSTIRIAASTAAGNPGAVPVEVAALVQKVLFAMSVPKIVTASFVLLAALAMGLGGLAYAQTKEGIKPSPEKRAAADAKRLAESKVAEGIPEKPKLSAIRLGVSRDEIVEKFGQPNDSVELASGIESLRYDRGPVRVLVEISPATKRVVQIYYKKATPFTSIQIAELLERNAEGSKWLPLAVSEDSCQYDRLDGGSARGGKVGETYQLAVLSGSVVKGRNPRADAEREKEKESLKEIE